jgi:hypothetical protein
MTTKHILVWPCSEDLKYHAILDTFINSAVPSEARNIYPSECIPDPSGPADAEQAGSAIFERIMTVQGKSTTVRINFIAVLDKSIQDEGQKALMDRNRGAVSVSSATVDAILLLALPGETNEACLVCTVKCSK